MIGERVRWSTRDCTLETVGGAEGGDRAMEVGADTASGVVRIELNEAAVVVGDDDVLVGVTHAPRAASRACPAAARWCSGLGRLVDDAALLAVSRSRSVTAGMESLT